MAMDSPTSPKHSINNMLGHGSQKRVKINMNGNMSKEIVNIMNNDDGGNYDKYILSP